MKSSKTLSILLFSLIIMFGACNTKKKAESQNKETTVKLDTTGLWIDVAKINSMRIIYTDNELNPETFIREEDQLKIQRMMNTAIYDSIRNRSDIMIKMVAPEYTLIMAYKNKSADDNDWFMLWASDNYVKYKNTWYTVSNEIKEETVSLLESYR